MRYTFHIWIVIFFVIGLAAGITAEEKMTIYHCSKSGRIIYNSNHIVLCQHYLIDEILNQNYWERTE